MSEDPAITPHTFIDSIQFTSRGEAIRRMVIRQVKVVRCVTIEPDGRFGNNANEPYRRPWFYLDCTGGPYNATFDIISDGYEWLPSERYKEKKLTKKMKPKRSVDLNQLSTADQELIQMAIYDFLNGKQSAQIPATGKNLEPCKPTT